MSNAVPDSAFEGRPVTKMADVASSFMVFAVVGTAAASLAAFYGEHSWVLDLMAHFRWHYLCLASIASVVLVFSNRMGFALISSLLALLNGGLLVPSFLAEKPEVVGDPIVICSANLHASNPHSDAVTSWIEASDPDVLVLMEVTPRWERELTTVLRPFGAKVARTRGDAFGILVAARDDRAELKVVWLAGAAVPSVQIELAGSWSGTRVIATHPVPPLNQRMARFRDLQLCDLTSHIGSGPAVVVGDLNATGWSYPMRVVMAESGLACASNGFGYSPTWLTGIGLFGIPIDHCLVSRDIAVIDFRVGPDIGSDHRPIVIELARAAATSK